MNTKVFSAFFLVLATAGGALAENRMASGIITLRDGSQIEAISIGRNCARFMLDERELSNGAFEIVRPERDRSVSIRPEEVASFTVLDTRRNGAARYIQEGVIELKNGNSITFANPRGRQAFISYSTECTVTVFDDFTERTSEATIRTVGDEGLRRIDFTGVGTYRWSESSEQVFPNSFLFDPYTGERTVIRGGAN